MAWSKWFTNLINPPPQSLSGIDKYKGDVYLKQSLHDTEFSGLFLYYLTRPYTVRYDSSDLDDLPRLTGDNRVAATVYTRYKHSLLPTEQITTVTFSDSYEFILTASGVILPLDAVSYLELGHKGSVFTVIPKDNLLAAQWELKGSYEES